MKSIQKIKKKFILIALGFFVFNLQAKAAEEISFVNGMFQKTISINQIESLANNEKATGFFGKISQNNSQEISNLLNQEYELPIMITSKLMHSKIGEVIIKRVAKIIYPFKVQSDKVSVPAIRAAVIKGLVDGNGKINLILFLKAYPNKKIAINVPALLRVVNKVESISELVNFFSGSPLNSLKDGRANT